MTIESTAQHTADDNHSSPQILWEYDTVNDCYQHIDNSITRLTGYSQEEWKAPHFRLNHIYEDDKEWATAIPSNQTSFEKEYRITTSSGDTVWVRDKITISKQSGAPTHLHGYMTDISDQKSVENAMQMLALGVANDDDDSFFQDCVANIAKVYAAKYAFIGILSDDKLSISTLALAVWANGKLADNFEYDLAYTPCEDVLCMAKELIPTNVTGLYPKDELLINMGVDSYFGTPLSPVRKEMTGLLAILDDKPMSLTSWTAPVLSLYANRIAVELVKRKQNVSLKRMMLEAQAASLAKSEFLANMSHELRTPMHSILAFSDLGLRKHDKAPREKLGMFYDNINSSANRLMALIDNLFDLSSLESGKASVELSENCLHHITKECIKSQQKTIDEKKIELAFPPKQSDSTVVCDADKINQVIYNLLSNAIKFTPQEGNIIISIVQTTLNDQEAITFEIKNTGADIPENELESIFNKFIQSSLTKDGCGGTGLGLAICKEIIKIHDGEIWANNHEGGGFFAFSLPINGCEK